MKLLFTLLFTVLLPFQETNLHDFHLSRTRIEYSAKQQEWQISLHVFIDDLELALEKRGVPDLRLGTQRESAEANDYIEKYLNQFFRLEAAGTRLALEWLGKETSEDLTAFHIYFFVEDENPAPLMNISNRILMDLYDDQQNMIQFVGPDKQNRQLLFHTDYWEEEVGITK
ncbi:MAG: DUF6702 family protein [Bacteroidota bacterium]